mmetsp:Transcript_19325/g.54265  ORF Transcript_19325/g.54265 Transcript_19325/m.54265 type:complete len:289 (+) Transcript_19325:1152-2018(+)
MPGNTTRRSGSLDTRVSCESEPCRRHVPGVDDPEPRVTTSPRTVPPSPTAPPPPPPGVTSSRVHRVPEPTSTRGSRFMGSSRWSSRNRTRPSNSGRRYHDSHRSTTGFPSDNLLPLVFGCESRTAASSSSISLGGPVAPASPAPSGPAPAPDRSPDDLIPTATERRLFFLRVVVSFPPRAASFSRFFVSLRRSRSNFLRSLDDSSESANPPPLLPERPLVIRRRGSDRLCDALPATDISDEVTGKKRPPGARRFSRPASTGSKLGSPPCSPIPARRMSRPGVTDGPDR